MSTHSPYETTNRKIAIEPKIQNYNKSQKRLKILDNLKNQIQMEYKSVTKDTRKAEI